MQKKHLREINSYVLRQGRMTKFQQQVLSHADKFLLSVHKSVPVHSFLQLSPYQIRSQSISNDIAKEECLLDQNYPDFINPQIPLIVEVGFGNGEHILQLCEHYPQSNILGIEVYLPGIARLIDEAMQRNLTNLKILRCDAKEVFQFLLPNNSISQIHVLFPDPWPKKKHHKRRLLQLDFINLMTSKLRSDGLLHIATDWQNYAEFIEKNLQLADPSLEPLESSEKSSFFRKPTHFEQRGVRLGHSVWDFWYHQQQ